MAIKGGGYTKTTWAFEERPVASSKLNNWDDRIEGALELIHFLLGQAWGGGSGVVRGATIDDLKVVAQNPSTLSALVQPGYAFISNFPYKLAAVTQTADVAIPTADSRIDLVQARLETWDVSIKMGVQSPTPVAPVPDTDALPLAHLLLRAGMTSVKDTDDTVNGYIQDVRTFL